MRKRTRFKLSPGESVIQQGENELHVTGDGPQTYIWIGGKGCYATLSGKKTLESLAASIYRALGHVPMWANPAKKKSKRKPSSNNRVKN
jgi:hypothetical protein